MRLDYTHLPSLQDLRADLLRSRYRSNPVFWVENRLREYLWSKQKEIISSVKNHRRTAVKSCHSAGKSFLAARVVCWFLDTNPIGEAFVVTSAPTFRQVRAILWREIGRAHSRGQLHGRLNQTEWWSSPSSPQFSNGNEEMIAFGIKPDDADPSAFQGIHADKVLLVMDEACGIAKPLWDSGDTLISNDESRILAIGNPDDPTSEFSEVCKPGSGWNVITISAFDTPNFTGEIVPEEISRRLIGKVWVEEKRRKWGEDNPLYIAKIKGEFPEVSTDGLIPIRWIKAAQEREIPPSSPNELGVDVGGGTNRSTIAHRQGSRVRIIHRSQDPNTMHLLEVVLSKLKETGANYAKVDYVGIGKGIVDRAHQMIEESESAPYDVPKRLTAQLAARIIPIEAGKPAHNPEEFINLRAEGHWTLRQRFEDGMIDIDPFDDDLAAQAIDVKYRHSGGRIQIESKEEMRRRGRESPDDLDAVVLAFLSEKSKPMISAVWGSTAEG